MHNGVIKYLLNITLLLLYSLVDTLTLEDVVSPWSSLRSSTKKFIGYRKEYKVLRNLVSEVLCDVMATRSQYFLGDNSCPRVQNGSPNGKIIYVLVYKVYWLSICPFRLTHLLLRDQPNLL